jgi:hypothetical protein
MIKKISLLLCMMSCHTFLPIGGKMGRTDGEAEI